MTQLEAIADAVVLTVSFLSSRHTPSLKISGLLALLARGSESGFIQNGYSPLSLGRPGPRV
jgi:hypothetical protein